MQIKCAPRWKVEGLCGKARNNNRSASGRAIGLRTLTDNSMFRLVPTVQIVQFPVRAKSSLFARENSLFRSDRELAWKALELLRKFTLGIAEMAGSFANSLLFSLFAGKLPITAVAADGLSSCEF